MYFSARTDGIRTFRHALRAAYRTAISTAQILVIFTSQARNGERERHVLVETVEESSDLREAGSDVYRDNGT